MERDHRPTRGHVKRPEGVLEGGALGLMVPPLLLIVLSPPPLGRVEQRIGETVHVPIVVFRHDPETLERVLPRR